MPSFKERSLHGLSLFASCLVSSWKLLLRSVLKSRAWSPQAIDGHWDRPRVTPYHPNQYHISANSKCLVDSSQIQIFFWWSWAHAVMVLVAIETLMPITSIKHLSLMDLHPIILVAWKWSIVPHAFNYNNDDSPSQLCGPYSFKTISKKPASAKHIYIYISIICILLLYMWLLYIYILLYICDSGTGKTWYKFKINFRLKKTMD